MAQQKEETHPDNIREGFTCVDSKTRKKVSKGPKKNLKDRENPEYGQVIRNCKLYERLFVAPVEASQQWRCFSSSFICKPCVQIILRAPGKLQKQQRTEICLLWELVRFIGAMYMTQKKLRESPQHFAN